MEGDAVAHGHVHGGHGVAGAENEADERGAVAKLGGVAGGGAGRGVLAGEPALGDADGRQVEEEAEVTGDAEAAGVRVAVAVYEDEVRGVFEALEGKGEQGDFAEGEEAGDIRECDGGLEDMVLDEAEVRVGEEDDGGAGEGGAAAPFDRLRVSGRDGLSPSGIAGLPTKPFDRLRANGCVKPFDVRQRRTRLRRELRVSGLWADESDVGGGDEADAGGIAGGDDAGGEAGLDLGGLPGGE